tara:strand:- start:53 stop:301 length:249 start_codon:yes stop_codon:yes gene_type:complete
MSRCFIIPSHTKPSIKALSERRSFRWDRPDPDAEEAEEEAEEAELEDAEAEAETSEETCTPALTTLQVFLLPRMSCSSRRYL